MSAVQEGADGPTPAIKVLFTLHPGFDTLDLSGPLEVLSWARHNIKDAGRLIYSLCRKVYACLIS